MGPTWYRGEGLSVCCAGLKSVCRAHTHAHIPSVGTLSVYMARSLFVHFPLTVSCLSVMCVFIFIAVSLTDSVVLRCTKVAVSLADIADISLRRDG